ncbi:MAG: type III pantothenate kinase [Desulfobacterales bacterium]|nr:type III pantothenate kinase [Desulfobacterales bacterium]
MILVIDVGNTNTVMGLFQGKKLVHDWRIRSQKNMTEDEFNLLVSSLFRERQIDPESIRKTVISSVVPPVKEILQTFCTKYLGHPPIWVNSETTKSIMPIRYTNPTEVGADRIVNAVAAYEKYQSAIIAIDFGTATTFDIISSEGEYMGGAISPGIRIASEALFANASKLPRVEICTPPERAIGLDTAESMKAGIIFGYAGLVDGMVERIKREMGCEPKVIATGGLASVISGVSSTIESVEPELTLEGLQIIAERLS